MDNATLEVHPLTDRLHSMLKAKEPLISSVFDGDVKIPHIIKRANMILHSHEDDAFPVAGNVWDRNEYLQPTQYPNDRFSFGLNHPEAASVPAGGLTLELAVFLDEAGYRIFGPHFNYDDRKLQDMLLAYMNGVSVGGNLNLFHWT